MSSSYKTSKGKNKDFARQNNFFAMPMPMPTSMSMLMPRCRYRDFQMVNIYPLQKKIPEIKSQFVFSSLDNIFVRSKAVSRKETYIYRCFRSELQKPLFWGILGKKCSENMPQIYKITPMPRCGKSHFDIGVSCKFAAYFQNTFS